jgi:phage gpG-like protein
MPSTVNIDLSQLAGYFTRNGQALSSLSFEVPFRQSRQLIVHDIEENFRQSHGPDGTPWPALAHPRANSQGSDKPLLDKGFLMASAVGPGTGHIEEMTGSRLIIGSSLPQAGIHQRGGTITPKNARALAVPVSKEAANFAWSPGNRLKNFPVPLALIQREGHPPVLIESRSGHGRKGEQSIVHFVLLPQVTIPARPFIGIGPDTQRKINTIFGSFVARKIASGGPQHGSA